MWRDARRAGSNFFYFNSFFFFLEKVKFGLTFSTMSGFNFSFGSNPRANFNEDEFKSFKEHVFEIIHRHYPKSTMEKNEVFLKKLYEYRMKYDTPDKPKDAQRDSREIPTFNFSEKNLK